MTPPDPRAADPRAADPHAPGGKGRGLDWPALMRLGLRELRLRPQEFWALTPAELMLMAGLDAAPAALSRARLDELAARYPDHPTRSNATRSNATPPPERPDP